MTDYLKALLGDVANEAVQEVDWSLHAQKDKDSEKPAFKCCSDGANGVPLENLLSGAYCSIVQFSRS